MDRRYEVKSIFPFIQKRFRAAGGVAKIISGHALLTNTDYAYLTQGLKIFDPYVRTQVAATIYFLLDNQFNQTHKTGLLAALNTAISVESIFQAKFWMR